VRGGRFGDALSITQQILADAPDEDLVLGGDVVRLQHLGYRFGFDLDSSARSLDTAAELYARAGAPLSVRGERDADVLDTASCGRKRTTPPRLSPVPKSFICLPKKQFAIRQSRLPAKRGGRRLRREYFGRSRPLVYNSPSKERFGQALSVQHCREKLSTNTSDRK
jgi:hypothetical protein